MKKLAVLLVVALFAFAVVSPAFAADKKSFKEATKEAGKATVNYPANVVKETVSTVSTATKSTVETVGNTVQATGETLTGKPERAKDIVVAPVTGVAKTVTTTTTDTVAVPVKAADDTKSQM
jgi:hypothetical protein